MFHSGWMSTEDFEEKSGDNSESTTEDGSIRAGLEHTFLLGRSQILTSKETEALGLHGTMVLLDGDHTKWVGAFHKKQDFIDVVELVSTFFFKQTLPFTFFFKLKLKSPLIPMLKFRVCWVVGLDPG